MILKKGSNSIFWMRSLLHFQCFSHSWYLSMDFQLFIIAPFIVLLIYKFKTKAVFGLSMLILGCIACTIGTFLTNDFEDYL